MFNVEQDLFLFSVIANQRMKRVAMGHPTDQAAVGGQRNHRVSLKWTRKKRKLWHAV